MSLEDLQGAAWEARGRALRLIDDDLSVDDLDKAQRALRRKIIHQLSTTGLGAYESFQASYGRAALYDSTRRALSLIAQLERCGELTVQQKSILARATTALYAAEDAAGAALGLT